MARTIHTQLLTPDGPLFQGEAEWVQVPGSSGNFQMLYNHAPIVSSLGVGKIRIRTTSESGELIYAVSGGFVEMSDNRCTVLAEKAELAGDIDAEEAKKIRDQLKKNLKDRTQDREKAEMELAVAENRVKVAESAGN